MRSTNSSDTSSIDIMSTVLFPAITETVTLQGNKTDFDNMVDNFTGSDNYVPNDTENITEKPIESYLAYQIGVSIHTYYLPVVVIVGFVWNCMALSVSLLKHNRKVSCCVYIAALSVSDNCMLYTAAHVWVTTDIQNRKMTQVECVIIVWLLQTFSCNGIWLIVSMTLDRCIAVRLPFRASLWCTTKKAKITTISLIIFMFIFNIPHLFYSRMVDRKTCAALRVNTQLSVVYAWFNIALSSLIPFISIFVMNVLIILTVQKRKNKFGTSFSEQNKNSISMDPCSCSSSTSVASSAISARIERDQDERTRDRQLTTMLLLVAFALLILTLPQYIRYVSYLFIDNQASVKKFAYYMLFYHSTNKLFYTNNAVNFILYCLGGSKFRGDVVNILCAFRRNKVPKSNTDTTS